MSFLSKFLWNCKLECDSIKHREDVLKVMNVKGQVLRNRGYGQEGIPEWEVQQDIYS